jgi:tRNA dimethylallyltransferase
LLAQRLGGEVVGADAFQIYAGLPILTAQPSKEEERAIPHHLIGVIPPTENFDVFRYRSMALPVIEKIATRGNTPLITGGTGLYFRALLSPFDPLPSANEALRGELGQLSLPELVTRLNTLDPLACKLLDIQNRRRVERAIEIITEKKLPLAQVWSSQKKEYSSARGLLVIRNREELFKRLEKNVQCMFERGVVEEVTALEKISFSSTASMTLGLRDIQRLQRGEQTLSETIAAITQATKRYAKRQLTWFKNQHTFPILNLSLFSSAEDALEEALRLLCN